MSAHTPGPWATDYLDRNGQRVVRGEHIEICTCWHHSVGSIEREMEANARLIAAAPDLLAALKTIDAYWTEDFPDGPEGSRQWAGGLGELSDQTVELWRAIKSAISKAEGE
jgi:hypothetical protein